MNRIHTRSLTAWKVLRVIASTAALTALAILAMRYSVGALTSHSRQAEVARRGAQVMPFDLDATTHIFQPHADGGIQQVIADNPSDTAQIALIRAHLQAEAAKFQRGDFSDPTTIHGMDMPGVAQLRAGYARIAVTYTELPSGAQLRYTTSDPALVAALRDWFAAQTSDHGEHAAPPSQPLQPTPAGDAGSTAGGEQHSFEPLSSVASLVPDLGELLEGAGGLTFVPGDQDRVAHRRGVRLDHLVPQQR